MSHIDVRKRGAFLEGTILKLMTGVIIVVML